MHALNLRSTKNKIIKWYGLTFQNINSPVASLFDWFHDYCIIFLIYIIVFVALLVYSLTFNFFVVKVFGNLQTLEFVWTILPAIILIFIGVPSIILLYNYDLDRGDLLTVKARGHQWYWSYDYSDFPRVEFDSYIKLREDLIVGEYRLLETDNRVILPFLCSTRFIIRSADVIHSWALPRIAAKVDANAGFINTINLQFFVPGVYYGQCREICGANHSFIPICVEVVSLALFKIWLNSFQDF